MKGDQQPQKAPLREKGTRLLDVDGLKYRPPMDMSSRVLWSMRERGSNMDKIGDEKMKGKTERRKKKAVVIRVLA